MKKIDLFNKIIKEKTGMDNINRSGDYKEGYKDGLEFCLELLDDLE